MMEMWQQMWTGIYLVGLGLFLLMAIVILPLGFRDLLRLLKDLAADEEREVNEQ